MGRFIGKRIVLSLITLVLLSIIVFIGSQVLPGDIGRAILGPLADQRSVDALNEQLGANRSLLTQYFDWVGGVLTFDMGDSLAFRRPVSEVLGDALVNSFKLAVLAFIIVVPLSIFGGVYAALNEGSKRDRFISLGGLSATAIPDFVWAVVLILIFSLVLGIFPATATAPPGSGFIDQIYYLILPAVCLGANPPIGIHPPLSPWQHAGHRDQHVHHRSARRSAWSVPALSTAAGSTTAPVPFRAKHAVCVLPAR